MIWLHCPLITSGLVCGHLEGGTSVLKSPCGGAIVTVRSSTEEALLGTASETWISSFQGDSLQLRWCWVCVGSCGHRGWPWAWADDQGQHRLTNSGGRPPWYQEVALALPELVIRLDPEQGCDSAGSVHRLLPVQDLQGTHFGQRPKGM
jgi:hypothetical protein